MSVNSSPTESRILTRNSLREGDHGLGIPKSRVGAVRVLSEKKKDELRHKRSEGLKQRDRDLKRQIEERCQKRDTIGNLSSLLNSIAGGLFSPLVGIRRFSANIRQATAWIRWATISVLGLLFVGLVASLLDDIKTLPTPLNWIVGVSATFFAAIIFVCLILRIRSPKDY